MFVVALRLWQLLLECHHDAFQQICRVNKLVCVCLGSCWLLVALVMLV